MYCQMTMSRSLHCCSWFKTVLHTNHNLAVNDMRFTHSAWTSVHNTIWAESSLGGGGGGKVKKKEAFSVSLTQIMLSFEYKHIYKCA